jgi:hypothetical protein
MSGSAPPAFATEVIAPQQQRHDPGVPGSRFLQELWTLRGLVLFDHGRRPAFQLPDGTFADPDPLDAAAHHIVFRLEERMVACARIALLSDVGSGTIAPLIGRRRFEKILKGVGTTTAETCEGARWTVVPECRKHGLGRQIILASWAVARWLGVKTAFVLAGTRDGQDHAVPIGRSSGRRSSPVLSAGPSGDARTVSAGSSPVLLFLSTHMVSRRGDHGATLARFDRSSVVRNLSERGDARRAEIFKHVSLAGVSGLSIPDGLLTGQSVQAPARPHHSAASDKRTTCPSKAPVRVPTALSRSWRVGCQYRTSAFHGGRQYRASGPELTKRLA